MGLIIRRREPAPKLLPYTIFDALQELADKKRVGTLMLVHNDSGMAYRVLKYNPDTKQVALQYGTKRKILTPILSERESKIYYPVWR